MGLHLRPVLFYVRKCNIVLHADSQRTQQTINQQTVMRPNRSNNKFVVCCSLLGRQDLHLRARTAGELPDDADRCGYFPMSDTLGSFPFSPNMSTGTGFKVHTVHPRRLARSARPWTKRNPSQPVKLTIIPLTGPEHGGRCLFIFSGAGIPDSVYGASCVTLVLPAPAFYMTLLAYHIARCRAAEETLRYKTGEASRPTATDASRDPGTNAERDPK